MTAYQKYAGCAMSFFRARWEKRPRFKNSTRREQFVSRHKEYCATARRFIAKARAAKESPPLLDIGSVDSY